MQATRLFVELFVPTLFEVDKDFAIIQSCFCILKLLLRYHEPEVSAMLQQAQVPPELYAPRWFYSVFANKCDEIETILGLWQRMLREPEMMAHNTAEATVWAKKRPLFTLTLALIAANRRELLCCDASDLLEIMAKLTFH